VIINLPPSCAGFLEM